MRHQAGFTLIEVMVAFMVMAIGLLGVMGLQNTAIRNNVDTTAQMQAVLLSKEMADLVRANPIALAARSYNNIVGANVASCTTTGCQPAQMAQYDKWLWDARLVESIGAGATGVVCVDSTPEDGTSAASAACDNSGNRWAVKIWWVDGNATEASYDTKGQQFTTADLLFIDTTDGPSYFMTFMP